MQPGGHMHLLTRRADALNEADYPVQFPVRLRIQADGADYRFAYALADGDWQTGKWSRTESTRADCAQRNESAGKPIRS